LLLSNIGCSFMAVRPSPQWNAETGKSECASAAWAVGDAVAAGGALFVAGLASALSGHPYCSLSNQPCPPASTVSPAVYIPGAILGVSALYGLSAVSACQSAPPLKRNPDAPSIPIPAEPHSQPFTAPPGAAPPSPDVGNPPAPSPQPAEPAPAAPPPEESRLNPES
jgi:hypothetical protein